MSNSIERNPVFTILVTIGITFSISFVIAKLTYQRKIEAQESIINELKLDTAKINNAIKSCLSQKNNLEEQIANNLVIIDTVYKKDTIYSDFDLSNYRLIKRMIGLNFNQTTIDTISKAKFVVHKRTSVTGSRFANLTLPNGNIKTYASITVGDCWHINFENKVHIFKLTKIDQYSGKYSVDLFLYKPNYRQTIHKMEVK